MVNLQDTPTAGPLRACDLDRATNTGRIYPGAVISDTDAETLYRQSCAEEGGQHREPSSTYQDRPGVGVLVVLLGWPAVAAVVGAIVVIVHNMPPIGG